MSALIYFSGYVVAYFVLYKISRSEDGSYKMKDKARNIFLAFFSWALVAIVAGLAAFIYILMGSVHLCEKIGDSEWWNKNVKW